jgi:hypothetical protein
MFWLWRNDVRHCLMMTQPSEMFETEISSRSFIRDFGSRHDVSFFFFTLELTTNIISKAHFSHVSALLWGYATPTPPRRHPYCIRVPEQLSVRTLPEAFVRPVRRRNRRFQLPTLSRIAQSGNALDLHPEGATFESHSGQIIYHSISLVSMSLITHKSITYM